MARPTKMTTEIVGKLEYAFTIGANIKEACMYADINRDTYYEWVKTNKKLSDRFEELQSNPIFVARETVYKGIKRDPDLALKFLERKKKDEFSTRSESDITTNGDAIQPILVQFVGQDVKAIDEPAND